MRKGALFVLVVLIFVAVFQLNEINADVVSLNSGGGTGIVINPDTYLEGFFSGEPEILSSCGNGILEAPYEECDDGNYVSGDGCSATCQIEGGGGGGGGGTTPQIPGEPYIRIDPLEIRRAMLINTNIEETIGITNLDLQDSTNFSIYSEDFDPDLIVNFWDEERNRWVDSFDLYLSAGEIHELRIRFSAPNNTGRYNGIIFIDGLNVTVSLNVQEKLLLFDSNIIVLNKDYLVSQGERLRTSVTLIPIGDKERMDVTLNYVIKDYDGKVYLTRSETVLIDNQVNFKRNFDTGVLPLGQYIVGLELIYPNGVAPSSAHFEVVLGGQSTLFGRLVFFLVNSILIILILIILLIIWRAIKRIQEKKKKDSEEKLKSDSNDKENKNTEKKSKTDVKDEKKPDSKEKKDDKEINSKENKKESTNNKGGETVKAGKSEKDLLDDLELKIPEK